MEGKASFSLVLLIIIAVLALALAGLTSYVFLFSGGSAKTEVVHEVTRPADEELVVKNLFESKIFFNLKAPDNKGSVIQANIELVYRKKVSGIKDIEAKIKTYEGAIKEVVITYFQNMTLEEAKQPQTKDKAKKDLVKKMNELLSLSEKEAKDIIFTINFNEWFYQ